MCSPFPHFLWSGDSRGGKSLWVSAEGVNHTPYSPLITPQTFPKPPCLKHTLQDIKLQELALIPAWVCIFSPFPELSCSPFPPTPLPKTITQQKPPHPAPNSCTAPRLPLFPVESCQGTGSEGQQSSSVVVGRFHGTVNLRHFALMLLKNGFSGTVERRNLALISRRSGWLFCSIGYSPKVDILVKN